MLYNDVQQIIGNCVFGVTSVMRKFQIIFNFSVAQKQHTNISGEMGNEVSATTRSPQISTRAEANDAQVAAAADARHRNAKSVELAASLFVDGGDASPSQVDPDAEDLRASPLYKPPQSNDKLNSLNAAAAQIGRRVHRRRDVLQRATSSEVVEPAAPANDNSQRPSDTEFAHVLTSPRLTNAVPAAISNLTGEGEPAENLSPRAFISFSLTASLRPAPAGSVMRLLRSASRGALTPRRTTSEDVATTTLSTTNDTPLCNQSVPVCDATAPPSGSIAELSAASVPHEESTSSANVSSSAIVAAPEVVESSQPESSPPPILRTATMQINVRNFAKHAADAEHAWQTDASMPMLICTLAMLLG